MKKTSLLHAEISRLLASTGHTERVAIGDAGLPIPSTTERIDLALTAGIPSFLQVLDTVLSEFAVEKIVLALEIKDKNPTLEKDILQRFPDTEIQYLTHEQFKEDLKACKAVIRSGECTPYANIILQSGVVF